jgi:hypothetical protein
MIIMDNGFQICISTLDFYTWFFLTPTLLKIGLCKVTTRPQPTKSYVDLRAIWNHFMLY